MRECPTVRVTVPNAPPVVSVPVQVPPVIKLAGGVRGKDGKDGVDGQDGQDGAPGVGVPAGGTTRQALVKASDADYNTSFETIHELPAGGHPNQVLRKVNNDDYNTEWVSIREAPTFPSGGGWKTIYASPGTSPAYIQAPRPAYGRPAGQILVTHGGNPTVPDPHQPVEAGAEWLDYTPIPALPDESGQFLGIQDGQLAWLHPIPPAIAGTDPQTLTIPANTPTEVAKNLCPNPTATAGGATIGSPATGATTKVQGVTLPEPTPNGTTTGIEFYLNSGTGNAGVNYPDGISTTPSTYTVMVYANVAAEFQFGDPAGNNAWQAVPANTWVQMPPRTSPSGARYLRARTSPTGAALTDRFYYTEIRSGNPIPDTFFTGNTPPTPTTTYQWDGPPHNSPSTKYTIDTTTQWTPITLIPPPPPTGTWTLTTTNGTITWEQTP